MSCAALLRSRPSRTRFAAYLLTSVATLLLPDWAQFRKDGHNELDGIEPDILVGFRTYDTPQQRVSRLLARLPAALEVVRGGKR